MSSSGLPQPSQLQEPRAPSAFAEMFDTSGQIRQIPQESIQAALAAGGKYAIRMTDPKGVVRYIPHDRVKDAMAAGGTIAGDTSEPGTAFTGAYKAIGRVGAKLLHHTLGVPTNSAEMQETVEAGKREQALPMWQRALPHDLGSSPSVAHSVVNTLGGPLANQVYSNAPAVADNAKKAVAEHKATAEALVRGQYGQALGHQVGATGYGGATLTAPILGNAPANAGEAFGRGDTEEGLAQTGAAILPFLVPELVKGAKGSFKSAPARIPPESIEGLTGLLKTKSTDPHIIASTALPEARAVAAASKLDLNLKGRALPEKVLGEKGVFPEAVRKLNAEGAEVSKPYLHERVDTSAIGRAYLDRITPEMETNAPADAKALRNEAHKFLDINAKGEVIGPKVMTLSDLNDFRVRMNNETNAYAAKSPGAQAKSDILARADAGALAAARDLQYDTVGKLSGQDLRALKQREGALIEARDDLTEHYHEASRQEGQFVASSLRKNLTKTTVQERLSTTYPSEHGVGKSVIKATIAPSPLEIFNNRLRLMFKDLGEAARKPSATEPVANGQVTPGHVAQENAFYTQARLELGANASPSAILQRAQQLKQQFASATKPQVRVPYKSSDSLTPAQRATAWMLAAKRGDVTPEEADRRAHQQVGRGTRLKRPKGADNE